MDLKAIVRTIESHQRFLGWKLHGISLGSWLAFAAIAICVYAMLLWLRGAIAKTAARFAAQTSLPLGDLLVEVVQGTHALFLLLLALWAGSAAIEIAPRHETIIDLVVTAAFLIQAGLWGNRLIRSLIVQALERRTGEEDAGLTTAMGAFEFIARAALWTLVGLLILDNLQIKVTSLIAGLGIGGVAVALATQSILGDLFASLSILLDQPFAVGHFIVVDDLAGTVEHVGVKTTRVRSLSGEEIVISNSDLLKSRIHNYKRFEERRVLFSLGVTYDTSGEDLAGIPALIKEIIQGIAKTRFDRAHFKDYGDSALNFEIVYYVSDPDYNLYMDIQQQINLAIFERFQQRRIEFAFPTRTVYVSHSGGGSSPAA